MNTNARTKLLKYQFNLTAIEENVHMSRTKFIIFNTPFCIIFPF